MKKKSVLSGIKNKYTMLTIGFSTKFYTLWKVDVYEHWTVVNGVPLPSKRTAYAYLRNLSFDLNKAKEKLQEAIGDQVFQVDLTLKGHSSFFIDTPIEPREKAEQKEYTFTFGKLRGQDIREAGSASCRFRVGMEEYERQSSTYSADHEMKDAVWQLERAMKDESTARRKVYARRRLIELGHLVRRDWFEKMPVFDPYNGENILTKEIKRKWMPKGLAKWQDEIGSKKGLWYADKARVELKITFLKEKMVETPYGVLYIMTFIDGNDHIVTYKGGKAIALDKNETIVVKATIKHNRNETYIQRLVRIPATKN